MLKAKYFTFLLLSTYTVLGYGNASTLTCDVNADTPYGTTQIKVTNNVGEDLVLRNQRTYDNYRYINWDTINGLTGLKSGNTAYLVACGKKNNSSDYIKLENKNSQIASIFFYTSYAYLKLITNCTLGTSAINGTCKSVGGSDSATHYCECTIKTKSNSTSR